MKKTLFACLACVGILLSCTKENATPSTPTLTTDMEAINVDSEGGSVNLKVTANVGTTTTITYDSGDGWITLMPKVLKGDGVLAFTFSKFLDYDATRTAKATIKGDGVEKVIPITQTGRPKPVATDLDLDKYNVYADVIGGSFDIAVATAGEWTATSDADWCTIENGSALGVGTFTIKVAKSEDYQYRTANVKVTSGSLERTVFVQHVGTKIGDIVWANANVDQPDTFGETCETLGLLYQWNTKKGYPSYTVQNTNDTGCSGDTGTVVPGFEGGPFDMMAEKWAEENDPCPEGWRVPTNDELKKLIGDDTPPANKFTVDFWKLQGMAVSGAFCGLDREIMKAECTRGNLNGAIFIPIAGKINRDTCTQDEWWNVMLWSSECVGQTWDMFGLWMCSANDSDSYGTGVWYGSRTAMSVRCVKK